MADDTEQTDKEPILVKGEKPEYDFYENTKTLELTVINEEAFEAALKKDPVAVKKRITETFTKALDPNKNGFYVQERLQELIERHSDFWRKNSKFETLIEETLDKIKADVKFVAISALQEEAAKEKFKHEVAQVKAVQSGEELKELRLFKEEEKFTNLYEIALMGERQVNSVRRSSVTTYKDGKLDQGYLTIQSKYSSSVSQHQADQRAKYAFIKNIETLDPQGAMEHFIDTLLVSLSTSYKGDYVISGVGPIKDLHPKSESPIDKKNIDEKIHEVTITALSIIAENTGNSVLMQQLQDDHGGLLADIDKRANEVQAVENDENATTNEKTNDANTTPGKPMAKPNIDNLFDAEKTERPAEEEPRAKVVATADTTDTTDTFNKNSADAGPIVENTASIHGEHDFWNKEEQYKITEDKAEYAKYKKMFAGITGARNEGMLHIAEDGSLIFMVEVAIDTNHNGLVDDEGEHIDPREFRAYDLTDNVAGLSGLNNIPFSDETQNRLASIDSSKDGIIQTIKVASTNDVYDLLHKGGQIYLATNEFIDLNRAAFAAAKANTPSDVTEGQTGLKGKFGVNANGNTPPDDNNPDSSVNTPTNAAKLDPSN